MDYDHQHFIRTVRDRTGLELEQAGAAVSTTLQAIGRALDKAALKVVAGSLPDPLATELGLGRGANSRKSQDFLADVAAHEHVEPGFAKEHAQVVVETLAGALDQPTRARIHALLPSEVAAWFVPYEPPEQRPPRATHPREGSLATARPGSQHPVSEAAPERGQHDSPAATTDPHGDTRLSSSKGISSERKARTIAKGRPGSDRPVSEEPE